MKFCNAQRSAALELLPEATTLCCTVDEMGEEHPITEFMIRRACEQMDADQLWPLADAFYSPAKVAIPETGAAILPFNRSFN